MRKMHFFCLSLVALLVLGCEKPTHRSLARDEETQIRQLLQLLDGVEDAASARAAAPKIEAVAKELRRISQARVRLGRPTEEERDQAHSDEMQEMSMKLMFELMRIQMDSDLAEPLAQAMKKLREAK